MSRKRMESVTQPVKSKLERDWTVGLVPSLFVITGIFLLWALIQSIGREGDLATYTRMGWPLEMATVIVANKARALWHAFLMLLAVSVSVWLVLRRLTGVRAKWRPIVAGVLVLLVAADAVALSRHYVRTMPLSSFDSNPVLDLLKKDMPAHRTALVSQDGFYNLWLTYLFPYHNILSVNVTQMPRMPNDYKAFLGALGRNPVRMWRLAAVGYVLAPAELWEKEPRIRDDFDLAYSYDVAPSGDYAVSVQPAPMGALGRHVVLRLKNAMPRWTLVGGWERCEDEVALQKLASPAWTPFRRLLVAPNSAEGLAPMDGEGPAGTVELKSYRSGRVTLSVNAERPAMLRFAEKYDPNWIAAVNGKPETVRRVDYIFQGVPIPAGRHEVELRYNPPKMTLWLQFAGFALALAAALSLLFKHRKRITLND